MSSIDCAVDTCEFSDCGKCKKDTVKVGSNSNACSSSSSDCTACSSYSPKKC